MTPTANETGRVCWVCGGLFSFMMRDKWEKKGFLFSHCTHSDPFISIWGAFGEGVMLELQQLSSHHEDTLRAAE